MLAKHALSQLSYGPVATPSAYRKIEPIPRGRNVANSLSQLSRGKQMVGLGRLELPTSRLSSARSNQLSYKPEPRMRPCFGQRRSRMKRHYQARSCQKGKRRRCGAWRNTLLKPQHASACLAKAAGLVREERETKAAKSRKWLFGPSPTACCSKRSEKRERDAFAYWDLP